MLPQEDRVQKIARKFKFSHGKKIVHIEDQPRYGSKDSLIKASSFESYFTRVTIFWLQGRGRGVAVAARVAVAGVRAVPGGGGRR